MNYFIKEVHTKRDLKAFIRYPDLLYKSCEYYIPALHSNQYNILSKQKNPAFSHCEARYWIAYQDKNIVGRIAAIINHRYNQKTNIAFMRFGWLDFIEDMDVLLLLLQAVEKWAREKGMQCIHGPLGFTSFDASGVLVEGFDEYPTAWGHYNFPYYRNMLEKIGYKKEVDWIEYRINVPEETDQKALRIAGLVKKRFGLKQAAIRQHKDIAAYTDRLFDIVNNSFTDIHAFAPLTPEQIKCLEKSFLNLILPDYISVVLNEKNEPVAFGLVIPSLTFALKKAKGLLLPFGFMHIRHALHNNDTVDMLLVGVKPEYQNKGAYALVFEKIFSNMRKNGIKYVETTRELETNEKVKQLWHSYDKRLHKRARCYIKHLI